MANGSAKRVRHDITPCDTALAISSPNVGMYLLIFISACFFCLRKGSNFFGFLVFDFGLFTVVDAADSLFCSCVLSEVLFKENSERMFFDIIAKQLAVGKIGQPMCRRRRGNRLFLFISIGINKKKEVFGGIRFTERAPSENLSKTLCLATADFANSKTQLSANREYTE